MFPDILLKTLFTLNDILQVLFPGLLQDQQVQAVYSNERKELVLHCRSRASFKCMFPELVDCIVSDDQKHVSLFQPIHVVLVEKPQSQVSKLPYYFIHSIHTSGLNSVNDLLNDISFREYDFSSKILFALNFFYL